MVDGGGHTYLHSNWKRRHACRQRRLIRIRNGVEVAPQRHSRAVLPVNRDGPGTVELVDLAQEHLVHQTHDASCQGRGVKGENNSMVVAP